MVKPDGVQRGLVGEIVRRIEARGYRLVGMKMLHVSTQLAAEHYAEHRDQPFFSGLVDFITSGPVVAMAWEGPGVVAAVRVLVGATDPRQAAAGTIRGDLGAFLSRNLVHASDSPPAAERELGLWFAAEELLEYARGLDWWSMAWPPAGG